MKASDIKKGNVVEYNNGVYQIRDIERSSPQGRGGNVRFRFIMYSVPGGNKLDASKRSQVMFMDRDDILNLFVVNNLPLPKGALPAVASGWDDLDDDVPF